MRKRLIGLIQEALMQPKYEFYTGGRNCAKGYVSVETIADYLLDNGVIVPPCKVGDTVYVKMQFGGIAEAEVRDYVHFLTCGFCLTLTSDKFDKEHIPFSEIGKTVFLTKEEAKLAELNNRDAINTEVNYSDAINVYRELNTHGREKSVSELAELKGTEDGSIRWNRRD